MDEKQRDKYEPVGSVPAPLDRATALQLFAASAVRLGIPAERAEEAALHGFDRLVSGSARRRLEVNRDPSRCGFSAHRRINPEVAVLQFLGRLSRDSRELAIVNNLRPHVSQYQDGPKAPSTDATSPHLSVEDNSPSPS